MAEVLSRNLPRTGGPCQYQINGQVGSNLATNIEFPYFDARPWVATTPGSSVTAGPVYARRSGPADIFTAVAELKITVRNKLRKDSIKRQAVPAARGPLATARRVGARGEGSAANTGVR